MNGPQRLVAGENDELFPAPGSGQIRVRAPRDTELIVETGSGGVIVDGVESDSALEDFRFDLHSVSGSITVGAIRAERGLRMGFGRTLVRGHTVSGSLSFP
jgi:hypothetical protein